MLKIEILLIAIPLIVRHVHHFWCTRTIKHGFKKRGILSVVVWFLSYVILVAEVFSQIYQSDTPHWSFWVGCVLLYFACTGLIISIHQLGNKFSEFICIGLKQRLIKNGIYAFVRHPLHYILLLEMFSMAVMVGSFTSWSLFALSMVMLFYRELDEEKFLEQVFGEEYCFFRKQAVALVDLFPKRKG